LQHCLPQQSALLMNAIHAIDDLCRHTNLTVSKAKVRYVDALLRRSGNPTDLCVGDRVFIMEGEMWKGPIGRRANLRYCYLLSDILIYTERVRLRPTSSRRSRTNSLRASIFGASSVELPSPSGRSASISSSPKYKIRINGILYLRNVVIDEKLGENFFTLRCGEKEWYFEPSRDCNIDLKTGWLENIKAAVSKCTASTSSDVLPCLDQNADKDLRSGLKMYLC